MHKMLYRIETMGLAAFGFLSAGLYVVNTVDAVSLKAHERTSSLEGSFASLSAKDTSNADGNPYLEPPFADFIAKFDIPRVHGSGIYVDLGNDKAVDGKSYREAGGKCPVFGKNIQLYQPQNNPLYKNDFLANIPSEKESEAAGNPLPGGFNNSFKLQDGTAYSPMSLAKLNSYSQLTAKTPLGKCAQMSYMTTATKDSEYRYTFVYDTKNELCYFLFITMQRLMGDRYCSINNSPAGLTWYCFEPIKSSSVRPYLVYGSSYVGQNPDAWETKCPNKAVADAVFGVWENGACVEHKHLKGSQVTKVKAKEDCWALAFNNPGVASDHPVSSSEDIGTWGYYFPSAGPNQPKSGGVGVNYASFYGGNSMDCALSKEIPTCLVPIEGAAAYTALSSLEEETMPACPSNFPETRGSCDLKKCKARLTTCDDGAFVTVEAECLPNDRSECDSNLGLIIGLSVGGVLLLAIAIGAFFLLRRKPKPPPKPEASRSHYVQDQAAAQRRQGRQSDLVQQAEPSFWEEAEADPDEGDSTQVLVDQEY